VNKITRENHTHTGAKCHSRGRLFWSCRVYRQQTYYRQCFNFKFCLLSYFIPSLKKSSDLRLRLSLRNFRQSITLNVQLMRTTSVPMRCWDNASPSVYCVGRQ